jgi:DNA-binding LacI/PurR family transcriptional regulator
MTQRRIDAGSPVAIGQQLRTILLGEIEEGIYKVGQRIPSERSLAELYQISRSSVRETIAGLLNEGVLFHSVGRGTFVAEPGLRNMRIPDRASTIGFWTSEKIFHFAEPGYQQTLAGIANQSRELGYSLQLHWVDEHRQSIQQLFNDITALANVAANIVVGGVSSAVLERLKAQEVPLVTVDLLFPSDDFQSVGVDYEKGTRLAMEHLFELGHQDVGFIGFADSKKYNVYWQTLEARGLRYQPRYVQFLDSASLAPGIIAGYQSMQKLVGGGHLPTAVLITNDYVALGALEALSVAGIRVPGEMSVIAFDDFAPAAVSLTSVRADLVELGRRAVRMLFDSARSQNAGGIVLPVELIVRATTAPPAIIEPKVAPSLSVK